MLVMFCKNCGKELKEGTLFCSGCGTKIELSSDMKNNSKLSDSLEVHNIQQNLMPTDQINKDGQESSKKNSKGCFAIITFIAVVIFIIVKLVSCSADSSYEIGESAELNGLEISVTSFDTMYSIADGDYVAEDGMIFAIVGVNVYNDGNSERSFMDSIRSYSELVCEGKEFSMASFWFPPSDLLVDAYIAPMASKEGYIVFRIPEKVAENVDEIIIKFIYDSGGIDEKNFEWEEDIESITFSVK